MGLLKFLQGYRTCYQCGQEGKRNEMVDICVPDGIMDHQYVLVHEHCAKEYLQGTQIVKGPFTAMANFAASHTPQSTLERLFSSKNN